MKVRFEIDIDYPELQEGYPYNKDERFRNADGNTFLFRDQITHNLLVCVCDRGLSEENQYALLTILQLPVNTRIIDSDEYEQDPIERAYASIANSLQEIKDTINAPHGEVLNTIDQRGTTLTEGISEATLLEALRIVANRKED